MRGNVEAGNVTCCVAVVARRWLPLVVVASVYSVLAYSAKVHIAGFNVFTQWGNYAVSRLLVVVCHCLSSIYRPSVDRSLSVCLRVLREVPPPYGGLCHL